MIQRRGLLAAGMALAATGRAHATTNVPEGLRLAFDVVRKGSTIGTHVLTFRVSGDVVDIGIALRIAVKLGPVTLYRYTQIGTERSEGGRFVSLEAETDNDGEALRVSARRDGERVIVDAKGIARQILPGDARPLTHWNRACMTAPLFSPQDGKALKLTAAPRGQEQVRLANGQSVTATRYSLTGESTLDDWYTPDDIWTALRAVATDGSIVDYLRTA